MVEVASLYLLQVLQRLIVFPVLLCREKRTSLTGAVAVDDVVLALRALLSGASWMMVAATGDLTVRSYSRSVPRDRRQLDAVGEVD
jgi:hypothetical protein